MLFRSEMLFSCFCERCLEAGHGEQRVGAERALSCLVECCLEGRVLPWSAFISESGVGELAKRRSAAITNLVDAITGGVDRSRFCVGLDLLSPALAPLVGQEYEELAQHCDWIKAMTYTRAIGPAGLPLEARSLVRGLEQAHREITRKKASFFVEGLLGLPIGSMEELYRTGGFSTDVLSHELGRAGAYGVPVLAGIELVDHPIFPTQITAVQASSMLAAAKAAESSVISCWNLLYIPKENYRLLVG